MPPFESYCNHKWLNRCYLSMRLAIEMDLTQNYVWLAIFKKNKLDINFKVKICIQKEFHSAFGYSYLYTYRNILSLFENCSDYHHIHHRWNSHIVLMTHCKSIFQNKHDKHLSLVPSNRYFDVLDKFHIIIFLKVILIST